MINFEIKSGHNFLHIEILRRSNPNAADFWDGNWLEAWIKAEIPGFSVNCPLSIRADEIANFLASLRLMNKNLRGQAQLQTMEGGLDITFKAGNRGDIYLNSQIIYPVGTGSTFKFALEMDQSMIVPLIQQVEAALTVFPSLGTERGNL